MDRKIPFGCPMIGTEEKNRVLEVLSSPILVHGPMADEFEDNFASFVNAPYAVSVSSCTAGMHLIYFAMGIGPGDEVLVPAQTHAATAHAVELTGAKAVFVDAELSTGNINIELIEGAITPNTKAIAVVHYLGAPVNMPLVAAIAKKHKLFLLEDCALAPGAYVNNIHAGLHGDAGVFSFYPVKHFTTAEGGMIVLKDGALAQELKFLRAFGVDRSHGERKLPGMYDVIKLGFNYRMSEIHAAIGIEQLKKLPDFLVRRKRNYDALSDKINLDHSFGNILPQPVNKNFVSSHYCLGLVMSIELSKKRADLMGYLSDVGVGSSVYYPQPVPRMSYYKNKYDVKRNSYSNAATISDQMIALPVGPHLNEEDMLYIGDNINRWIEGNH